MKYAIFQHKNKLKKKRKKNANQFSYLTLSNQKMYHRNLPTSQRIPMLYIKAFKLGRFDTPRLKHATKIKKAAFPRNPYINPKFFLRTLLIDLTLFHHMASYARRSPEKTNMYIIAHSSEKLLNPAPKFIERIPRTPR